ncbi:MAG: hypothetical protein OFPI_21670 [Osedax symbiont Rs2]|nr:MAG: hypothetical protein OFPI_21670 [Osedax symbiont Rs2]
MMASSKIIFMNLLSELFLLNKLAIRYCSSNRCEIVIQVAS